ncbi:MAG: peptidoglycan-binding protein [Oscillatoria sp. PMC 1051.18]|uniref:peptidoglycan-binding domain-containing protein n=1 Tax=Oscillatoria salina TaxID=331517 RepID=UPI0013BC0CAB|nr:peptidoglycan-binding protein [Oscillatoria salina]MBZ8179281.1 peptidoglycan-binding protein [Oscillatoria salina IIICB1]MEC4894893.1 peptidoglycan-binding protein [Oscillatoria sp. PMC 1050.18]MEC5031495.1 peptidoglycan-binding protein [Oscillatoria sp. PMC 1051.18]NET86750.1 peptidoglycan-binding protein [Kamptonema sp. SIO1D9]
MTKTKIQIKVNKPLLQLGDRGNSVRELQELLADRGVFDSEVDSVFDEETEMAVKKFQYRMFLPVDGIVGEKTWESLYKDAPVNLPLLERGSRGAAVETLQTALQESGEYRGKIDGIFGSKTEAAVMAFQRRYNLIADGMVGENTWKALTITRTRD